MHELNINVMQFMLGVNNYIIIMKDLNKKKLGITMIYKLFVLLLTSNGTHD
jgi:hypothetical protein